MFDHSNIRINQTVQEQLSINNAQEQEKKEKTDENQFLELLVAQLKNQNPLDPQDGAEFLSQLAQFSTVDGIERLNTSMSDLSVGFRSSQALQASALVGRKVEIVGDRAELGIDRNLTGSVHLPYSTTDLEVGIYTLSGELVREIPLGSHTQGLVSFKWDGLNQAGEPAPEGFYNIVSNARNNDESVQLETRIGVNVDSVTVEPQGNVTLNLKNLGSVALSEVTSIK